MLNIRPLMLNIFNFWVLVTQLTRPTYNSYESNAPLLQVFLQPWGHTMLLICATVNGFEPNQSLVSSARYCIIFASALTNQTKVWERIELRPQTGLAVPWTVENSISAIRFQRVQLQRLLGIDKLVWKVPGIGDLM